jgi:hypothetical protein
LQVGAQGVALFKETAPRGLRSHLPHCSLSPAISSSKAAANSPNACTGKAALQSATKTLPFRRPNCPADCAGYPAGYRPSKTAQQALRSSHHLADVFASQKLSDGLRQGDLLQPEYRKGVLLSGQLDLYFVHGSTS